MGGGLYLAVKARTVKKGSGHEIDGQTVRVKVVNTVRVTRIEKGWNLDVLAGRAKCSPTHLARVERGEREPGVLLALRIAIALDRTVAQLWPSPDPVHEPVSADLFGRKME